MYAGLNYASHLTGFRAGAKRNAMKSIHAMGTEDVPAGPAIAFVTLAGQVLAARSPMRPPSTGRQPLVQASTMLMHTCVTVASARMQAVRDKLTPFCCAGYPPLDYPARYVPPGVTPDFGAVSGACQRLFCDEACVRSCGAPDPYTQEYGRCIYLCSIRAHNQTVTFEVADVTNDALFLVPPVVSATGEIKFEVAPFQSGYVEITALLKGD